jgi:hypothetical protein
MDNVARSTRKESIVLNPMTSRGCLVAAAAVALALAPAALAGGIAPPNAAGFAAVLATSTTDWVKTNGASLRIERTDCVEPRSGRYMCSYALRAPGGLENCHLVQARWTPASTSLYTVTLAGRTRSCANLSDALHSLDAPQLTPA